MRVLFGCYIRGGLDKPCLVLFKIETEIIICTNYSKIKLKLNLNISWVTNEIGVCGL